MYPCVAASPKAFVEQLAYAYIHYGYRYYVTGVVPQRLAAGQFDARIIEKFGLDISRHKRRKQRSEGFGSIHFIRHNRFWVLISTPTTNGNKFFASNTESKTGESLWHDVWNRAITFDGYAIRAPQGEISIKIDRYEFKHLKNELLEVAKYEPAEQLTQVLKKRFHYKQYPGVQKQLYDLVQCLNERLKAAHSGFIRFSDVKRGQQRLNGRRFNMSDEMSPEQKRRAA